MDQPSQIRLQVNGQQRSVPEGISLEQVLDLLELQRDRVAIEYNLSIVHRDAWPGVKLRDGDRLEIVQFVGGG